MTKQELRKQFDTQWKQKNQVKYVVWLIFYIGSFVPLAVLLFNLIGGLNDKKVYTIAICIILFFVMEVIAAVVNLDRNRSWKQYLNDHAQELAR